MKRLLLASLLLSSVLVIAQQAPGVEAAQPFKGANTILLHTPDSAQVAYSKLAKSLLAAGYGLEKSDKELGFISTTARPAPRYNMMYACKFFVKPTPSGSDIQASGTFTLPGAAAVSPIMAGETQMEYRGGSASTFMICWNAMQKTVQAAYPALSPAYTRLP
jgi:hypothetical protein